MQLLNGKFIDDNGNEVAPRFGDEKQCALLRRLERLGDYPLLNIETDSVRVYSASCKWTCPQCGMNNFDNSDPDHEHSDDAIDELISGHWRCNGCKIQFAVIENSAEFRLALPGAALPTGFRIIQ